MSEKTEIEKIKEGFDSHIGFEKEKDRLAEFVYCYRKSPDEFYPEREVVCYAGAPGTGKTAFVKLLETAMGWKLAIIQCAGSSELSEFSDDPETRKTKLTTWIESKTNSNNKSIILFDELEKAEEGSGIQKNLTELFKMYKEGEDEKLNHILFFSTVNYPEKLSPLLKLGVSMRILGDYTDEEKIKILESKKKKIEENLKSIYGGNIEIDKIIPNEIIKLLPQHIQEAGIRQTERVLYKIEKEYIKDQKFSMDDPKKWLKDNVLAYQENFCPKWKQKYILFPLWGIIWVLSLMTIIKKVILKPLKSVAMEQKNI